MTQGKFGFNFGRKQTLQRSREFSKFVQITRYVFEFARAQRQDRYLTHDGGGAGGACTVTPPSEFASTSIAKRMRNCSSAPVLVFADTPYHLCGSLISPQGSVVLFSIPRITSRSESSVKTYSWFRVIPCDPSPYQSTPRLQRIATSSRTER